MLTLSILALVVSTGALALGVHSTRVANGATGRARQQELRDQLQIVVARLPEEFLAVAVKVGIANDAGGVPASFNGLRERLDGIAQRLADRTEVRRVDGLVEAARRTCAVGRGTAGQPGVLPRGTLA